MLSSNLGFIGTFFAFEGVDGAGGELTVEVVCLTAGRNLVLDVDLCDRTGLWRFVAVMINAELLLLDLDEVHVGARQLDAHLSMLGVIFCHYCLHWNAFLLESFCSGAISFFAMLLASLVNC